MANRIFACASVLAVVLASPLAFADNDGFRALNNEAGSEFVGKAGTMSRDEVKRNLQASLRDGTWRLTEASTAPTEGAVRAAFSPSRAEVRQAMSLRDRPAAAGGWRDIGGEGGWVSDGR